MTTITVERALLEQTLEAINSFEQNYGNLWQSPVMPEQLDSVCAAIRAALAAPATDDRHAQLVRQQASYEAEIKVEIDSALERAAMARMKLPPPRYGGDVTAIQCVYQDAFDRGWKAGIAEMRKAIRALKEGKK